MLLRKGIFSRLDDESVNGHNRDVVMLWRKVLDEMMIALVGTNTSAAEHSERWFNSKPGDLDYYICDVDGREYEVDTYEEFCEVCENANLDPTQVQEAARRAYEIILNDGDANEHHRR